RRHGHSRIHPSVNRDFVEMLAELSAAGADFLVVGAHALAAHNRPRATGDLDLWIRPTPENARRVWTALERFGAPLQELTLDDLSSPGVVFQIGLEPNPHRHPHRDLGSDVRPSLAQSHRQSLPGQQYS